MVDLGEAYLFIMGNSSSITNPFDPSEISIDTKKVSMDTLMRRLQQGTIQLSPDFQRKEVWNEVSKSRLIESLMLNIPIQMFYVAADGKNNWTVVDGLQRISTFRDFVLGKEFMKDQTKINNKGHGFRLQGLEFLKNLENLNIKDIEKREIGLYNRIMETEFSFTIINPGTHEEVKRNIFKRINTGGEPLQPQEIRNALYAGSATKLLKKLAEAKYFKDAMADKISSKRMEDQEWVLGFLAFLIRPYKYFNRLVSMDDWLSETMIILNSFADADNPDYVRMVKDDKFIESLIEKFSYEELESRFERAIKLQIDLFKKHAFRTSHGHNRRTPINRRIFETWGVLLSALTDEEYNNLKAKRREFMVEYGKLLEGKNFKVTLSRHGMDPSAVKKRFNDFSNLLSKYTSNDN